MAAGRATAKHGKLFFSLAGIGEATDGHAMAVTAATINFGKIAWSSVIGWDGAKTVAP